MTVGQTDRHTDRIDHLTPCTYIAWGNNYYHYEDSASMPLSGSLHYRLSLPIWKVFLVTKTVDIKIMLGTKKCSIVMEMMDVAIDLSVCTPALNWTLQLCTQRCL